MKLSRNIKQTGKATKTLKIKKSDLEIEAKEKDYITADAKSIILLLKIFYILYYTFFKF